MVTDISVRTTASIGFTPRTIRPCQELSGDFSVTQRRLSVVPAMRRRCATFITHSDQVFIKTIRQFWEKVSLSLNVHSDTVLWSFTRNSCGLGILLSSSNCRSVNPTLGPGKRMCFICRMIWHQATDRSCSPASQLLLLVKPHDSPLTLHAV